MSGNSQIITSKYLIFFKRLGNGNKLIMRNLLLTGDYEIDNTNIDLLRECKTAKNLDQMIEKYGAAIINDYIQKKILLPYSALWKQNFIEQVEIEIGTICDFSCRYCPVSTSRKENKVMSMLLFNEIIQKVSFLSDLKFVSFSSYNEPLLDPFFEERVNTIVNADLKLRLITNASHLSEEKLHFLLKTDCIDFIKINIPSVEPEEYIRLTRTNIETYERVIQNVENALNSGLDVKLSVNGTKKEITNNLNGIRNKYERRIIGEIEPVRTLDRAGFLRNEYFQNISVKGDLPGWCFRPLTWLVISIEGDFCLCCNDYEQKHVYGNIRDGNIEEIINSNAAQLLRRQVYGDLQSEEDFICRKCEYMERGVLCNRYNPLIK